MHVGAFVLAAIGVPGKCRLHSDTRLVVSPTLGTHHCCCPQQERIPDCDAAIHHTLVEDTFELVDHEPVAGSMQRWELMANSLSLSVLAANPSCFAVSTYLFLLHGLAQLDWVPLWLPLVFKLVAC